MEVRNPKSETRKKAEGRSPNKAFGCQSRNHERSPAIFSVSVSDFGFRVSGFFRRSAFGLGVLPPFLGLFTPLLARAADTNDASELPASSLRPPRGEILPSFWEEYGIWIVLLGILGLALIALGVWLITRPRPMVPVPLAVAARNELEPLRQHPENGALLSRTSQILRRYIAAMFGLPGGELTTAEFCTALLNETKVGPELARDTSEFLRACDLRKFAPLPPGLPPGVVDRALSLIDRAQNRLTELNRPPHAIDSGSNPPPLPVHPKGMPSGA